MVHPYHLSLTVGIGAEIEDLRPGCAFPEVVFLVARKPCDCTTLDITGPFPAILVYHIVNGARIIPEKYLRVNDILSDELLLFNLGDQISAILPDNNDIINVRTITHILILFKPRPDESLLAVHVKFCIVGNHLGGLNGLKAPYLGPPLPALAVLFPDLTKVVDGIGNNVGKMVDDLLQVCLKASDMFIGA